MQIIYNLCDCHKFELICKQKQTLKSNLPHHQHSVKILLILFKKKIQKKRVLPEKINKSTPIDSNDTLFDR